MSVTLVEAHSGASTSTKESVAPSYAPPTGPAPLKSVHLDDRIQYPLQLATQGWTALGLRIDKNQPDPLRDGLNNLLDASRKFFEQPLEEKQRWTTRLGSEEGWSRVEGEKELITLRSAARTPEVLLQPAKEWWQTCGTLLDSILGRIAESLGLPAEALSAYSSPCTRLKDDPTATMLRLFRYEGESAEDKLVAEPHNDLGLLSMVFGDVPGLEVWDRWAQDFFPLEKTYEHPCASVLCGTQLARLCNERYIPGGHRVVSYAPDKNKLQGTPNYRFSIVFILRAHWPVPIDTDKLTTIHTGPFSKPMRNIVAGDVFRQISNTHFNINTSKEDREKQRQKLQAKEGSGRADALKTG